MPKSYRRWHLLANVDISTNPNPFNFLTAESEYIKKLEYEYIIFKIDGIHESNYFQAQKSENMIPVLLRHGEPDSHNIYLVKIHMNPFMA